MKGRLEDTSIRVAGWCLAGCLAALAAACGGATDPPANRAPVAVGSIPPLTIDEREESGGSVARFFDDPDGDTLSFAAMSSDTGVATAAMSHDSIITVKALEEGTATVTVTATDPDGESAVQTAAVTVLNVNRAPETTKGIGTRTIERGMSDTLLLSDHFSDPDGDTLTYAAASDDEDVAAADLDGAELRIRGVGPGTATITVTATDPDGASVSQVGRITVPHRNRAPIVTDSIESEEWEAGTFLVLDLSSHFSDPDGDELTFEGESDDWDVVEAEVYDEELEMYGVEAGSTTITVTATDPDGLSATIVFTATIVEGE